MLARTGTKLDKDVQLAIIVNGLPEKYRYLTITLESQDVETIDFDELFARLIEEERKFGDDVMKTKMVLQAKAKLSTACNYCHKDGHWKRDCPELKAKESQVKIARMVL